MEKEKRKIHIERETSSNESIAIFEEIESEAKRDVENFLEDSETKFIVEEEFPDLIEDTHQFLKQQAVFHIESKSNESEPSPKKKLKVKIPELKWKRQSKFIKERKCNLEAKTSLNLPENSNPLKTYEATADLNELVQCIREQTNLYAAKNRRESVTSTGEIRDF